MYYRCNAGGWNRSHGQVEQTPRLDSFELPMGKPWATMYCGCPDRGDKPIEVDAEGSTAHLYLTAVVYEQDLVETHGRINFARKTVNIEFPTLFSLELLTCNLYYYVHFVCCL